MNNLIIFTNGPARRPYCECLQLFVEKENKYKWVITIGRDEVLCQIKESKKYDRVSDRLVMTNDNPLWKNKAVAYWENQEDALVALQEALGQDPDLFGCDFLFTDATHPNTIMREKLTR